MCMCTLFHLHVEIEQKSKLVIHYFVKVVNGLNPWRYMNKWLFMKIWFEITYVLNGMYIPWTRKPLYLEICLHHVALIAAIEKPQANTDYHLLTRHNYISLAQKKYWQQNTRCDPVFQ